MEILIKHRFIKKYLYPELLKEVRTISRKYGKLSEKAWLTRFNVVDLVIILDIVDVFSMMGEIIGFNDCYLLEDDWFPEKGRKTQSIVYDKLQEFSKYLSELFSKVIMYNRDRYGAIVVSEHLDNMATFYTVLNHKRMTGELISSLPFVMAKVVKEIIIESDFPDDGNKIAQLFPNFNTDSWDYLFVPSRRAFGKFIDRYIDLRDGKYHMIDSLEEFRALFSPHDRDIFKFLINSNKDYDVSILDKL